MSKNGLLTARCVWLATILLMAPSLHGWAEAADVAVITRGDRVELASHLSPDKYTLFDFYADWCTGCRQIEPIVSDLAAEHADHLAVRKIDIVSWSSPVAGQYRLRSLPHLMLFDPEGEMLTQGGPGLVLGLLESRLGADPANSLQSPTTIRTDQDASFIAFLFVAVALLAVAGLLYSSLRRPQAAQPSMPASSPDASDAEPGWFVIIQGSLEGPFSATQLDDMCKRSVLNPEAKVRRQGEVSWQTLSDVISYVTVPSQQE
jgi:thiol-disulfide isomerase/thioredoxin